MFLDKLPPPIEAFLTATRDRDTDALLATLTDDAVLTDIGKDRSGGAIREWNDVLYIGANVVVHPIHFEERGDSAVLSVTVDGDYASYRVTEPFQLDWHIDLRDSRIARIRMVEVTLDLPAPISTFVKAMNMYDDAAMSTMFAHDALVIDQQRQHLGREAIRSWAAKEIAGDKVTMYVTEIDTHAPDYTVTARVTGNYDKTGLPDPLTLRFDFVLGAEGITKLIIVPAMPIPA